MGKKSKAKTPALTGKVIDPTPSGADDGIRGLYVDDEGRNIVTNSMLTTFRRCHKQAEYKYVHRLKPKMLGSPLKRGTWVHELLEIHTQGGDWRKHHAKLSKQFDQLFDEEKEFYGDMPREILHIMNSYMWHYKKDPWIYHEAEMELECELPDGTIFRGKVDNLIENEYGLWLVDHKTHKSLPNLRYRMLDTQAPRYIWAAHQNGIPVTGFIWNYLRWKEPTVPQLVYKGTKRERLSTRQIETDYPTYRDAIDSYGLDRSDHADRLKQLKAQRYKPGQITTSPFFQRVVMEKKPDLLERVLKETLRTSTTMTNYDFEDVDAVERTVGRHCEYMCSFADICGMELLGANIETLIKQNYDIGDPMSYYHDKAGDIEGKEI